MGPGTYTSMTQVAADALGLPMHRVRFALGDSRFPEAPSHSGSQDDGQRRVRRCSQRRTCCATGSIRTAVVDPGSPLNGLRPEDVAVADGRMFQHR